MNWTPNWYGLLIGLGILVGYGLVKKRVAEVDDHQESRGDLETIIFWVIVGGLLGARFWHVITAWSLYQENLWAIVAVWQGGLSIIGGLLGGWLALGIYHYTTHRMHWWSATKWWGDVAVFGLPVAQAIGRVGNVLNQELYGPPTKMPWGIFIDEVHRLPGWQAYSTFHPLFAYEALPLVLWAGVAWRWRNNWPLGKGKWLVSYLTFYAWLRVGLETLRLDKNIVSDWNLGLNQVVLACLGMLGIFWLFREVWQSWFTRLVMLCLVVGWLGVTTLAVPQEFSPEIVFSPSQLRDRQQLDVKVGEDRLTVEVVNSPESITLGLSGRSSIGSDGMLFIMPGTAQLHSFWMKEMRFALDIIWINQGKVVDISRDVPAPEPGQSLSELPVYRPSQPASLVLEVPAGTAAEKGWQAGTAFEWYH